MNWRENVNPALKDYLEALIKSTKDSEEAFGISKNKANAQLWIALSVIYKQTFNLDQRIKYIEKILRDILEEVKQIKEKQEMNEIKLIQKKKK